MYILIWDFFGVWSFGVWSFFVGDPNSVSGQVNALSRLLPDATGVEVGRYMIGGSEHVFRGIVAPQVAMGDIVDMVVGVPLWLIVALSAVAILGLWVMASSVSGRRGNPGPSASSPASAQIFGIHWRWTVRDGAICDLGSYCPRCNRPVSPSEETRHGFLHLIAYRCDCSGWHSRSFQCSRENFIARVTRAIQQAPSGKGSAMTEFGVPRAG